ncbi:MAG: carboxypeptidase-like regulatory domain-containing protein, partial [bacterium]
MNLRRHLMLIILLFFISLQIQAQDKQDKMVTGTITDSESGEVIPGVNVVIKGTTTGTTTDINGKFSLEIPEREALLRISFIGYLVKELEVVQGENVKIALEPATEMLQDVVVVGYGVQKKRDVTGAISSVSTEELERSASTGLDQALQGKSAGVYVSQNSNAPGGGVSIRIRGVHSTTGGNEPLYVVDGVPVSNSSGFVSVVGGGQGGSALASINPDD